MRAGRALKRVSGLLALAGLTLLLVTGSIEILLRLALGLDARSAAQERADFASRLPASVLEGGEEGPRRIVQMAYGARFELHPSFGYTFARGQDGANDAGFYAGGLEYPYTAAPDEFVVGIFGGSVAMQVAGAAGQIQEALLPVVRPKGYERVTVASFAVGAWRQPQSFHAFVRYLPTIDLAIVVDGFNEVIQFNDYMVERWPAEFPTAEVFSPLSENSAYEGAEKGWAQFLNQKMARATDWLNRSRWRHSMLAHLAWRALAAQHQRLVGSAGRSESHVRGKPEDPSARGTPEERVAAYYAYWADLVRNMQQIGANEHKPVLHFVQPNQYVRGSKPLSAEELEKYVAADNFELVTREYRRVHAMTERLSADGVESYDLSDLFREETETVYSDACCHFNDGGVRQLTAAVLARVLASPSLELVPRASGRSTSAGEGTATKDAPSAAVG